MLRAGLAPMRTGGFAASGSAIRLERRVDRENGSNRPKRVSFSALRLVSFWSFLALLTLLLLQALSFSGPLLAAAGAAYVAGWLVHVGLFSLLVEALIGRFSRAIALLPIALYSGYYISYWQQNAHIQIKSSQLQNSNRANILNFNPNIYSLVMDQAQQFVASHDIPSVYSYNSGYRPSPYLSYRLISADSLPLILQQAGAELRTHSVYFDEKEQPNLRVAEIPERPPGKIVTVLVRDDPDTGWNNWNISEQTTELSLDGKTIGAYRSGFVQRLPIFPFLAIGCHFPAGARGASDTLVRKCYIDFVSERRPIESAPQGLDRARFDDPVSILLGIRGLTAGDFKTFRGYDDKTAIAGSDRGNPPPTDGDAFDALQAIVNGQNIGAQWSSSSAIARNPGRLKPLAGGMAKRLLELVASNKTEPLARRQQIIALSTGLAALQPNDFASVGDGLSELLRREAAWDNFPALYLRLADLGPRVYPYYRDRFLSRDAGNIERLLASIAICRVGQADNELISAMRAEFSGNAPDRTSSDNFKASLFVTLLKLGQESYLKATYQTDAIPLKAWYGAVLSGKGKTDMGPNNCMPFEWPRAEFLPASVAPRLTWRDGAWDAAVQE